MSVTQNRAQSEDTIEAFECLSRHSDCWSEATDIRDNVSQNMTLGFGNYLIGFDVRYTVKESVD